MHTIGKMFGILCRQFTAFLNHELIGSELNAQQLMYLGALFQNDGVTQDDLARQFYIDKAAVARALHDMEQKGLIYRVADEDDHRAKRVHLTDAAQPYRKRIEEIQQKWMRICNGGLTQTDMEVFEGQLSVMARHVIDAAEKGWTTDARLNP